MTYKCKIDPAGGPVTLKVVINNGLRSGGSFGVFEQQLSNNWLNIEKLNTKTGNSGTDSKVFSTSEMDLIGKTLTWQNNICAFVDGLNHGTLDISFHQGSSVCSIERIDSGGVVTLVDKISNNLSDLPSCSEGKHFQTFGKLLFY